MPTALRIGPYRFFFYSNENAEPAHIHVEAAGLVAKYWLASAELASNRGFAPHELTKIQSMVEAHRSELLGSWNAHFGGTTD